MCLAVPGEVVEIKDKKARVDFGGAEREVKLDLLEEVSEGDYVLVHVGYAIQKLSQEEAEETMKYWREVADARTRA